MIQFDANSSKPKYLQLIEGIIDAIDSGTLARGEQLPSINVVANEFGMARMTVTKAYDELRERFNNFSPWKRIFCYEYRYKK